MRCLSEVPFPRVHVSVLYKAARNYTLVLFHGLLSLFPSDQWEGFLLVGPFSRYISRLPSHPAVVYCGGQSSAVLSGPISYVSRRSKHAAAIPIAFASARCLVSVKGTRTL